jgi:hypothetical protein
MNAFDLMLAPVGFPLGALPASLIIDRRRWLRRLNNWELKFELARHCKCDWDERSDDGAPRDKGDKAACSWKTLAVRGSAHPDWIT